MNEADEDKPVSEETMPGTDEIVDAELADEGGVLTLVDEPLAQPLVDFNTVLYPGQDIPTADDGPTPSIIKSRGT